MKDNASTTRPGESRQTLYESVTSSILAAMERGVVPWRKPWACHNALPTNVVTNRPYRGANVFLLSMSGFEDHRWLTFKQVQERGGHVKAGERSTPVIFWTRWKPQEAVGEEDTEPRHVEVPLLRSYRVFNAEQCDGLNLPELYRSEPLGERERVERADLLVQSMPSPPVIQERGRAAWYKPASDLVQVPPLKRFDSVDSFYGTLFHELGHATGHPTRLNRKGVAETARFGSRDYSHEELVAELSSAFCCALLGLDNSVLENAASYIHGWMEALRDKPKVFIVAAAQAQKAADYISGLTSQS